MLLALANDAVYMTGRRDSMAIGNACDGEFKRYGPSRSRYHFTVEHATLGLRGFTSILRSFGETTKSMSSIGMAPRRT